MNTEKITIPSASFIEMGCSMLKQVSAGDIAAQAQELHEANAAAASQINAAAPIDDFTRGYLVGLQTARVLLALDPRIKL